MWLTCISHVPNYSKEAAWEFTVSQYSPAFALVFSITICSYNSVNSIQTLPVLLSLHVTSVVSLYSLPWIITINFGFQEETLSLRFLSISKMLDWQEIISFIRYRKLWLGLFWFFILLRRNVIWHSFKINSVCTL